MLSPAWHGPGIPWSHSVDRGWLRRCLALGLFVGLALLASRGCSAAVPDCDRPASAACYFSFQPAGRVNTLHYFASRPPGLASSASAPDRALIVLHGHPRDANRTFDAALKAALEAGQLQRTLVIAPLFQVAASQSARCETAGNPDAETDDLVWTCQSWLEGAGAQNDSAMTAFLALDALVREVKQRWPSITLVTLAGFSAGAQLIQHYIGFSAPAPPQVALRFVVADPGSWLYFDNLRPIVNKLGAPADWSACQSRDDDPLGGCELRFELPQLNEPCIGIDHWKYGLAGAPTSDPSAVREHYRQMDVTYLLAQNDQGSGPGTAFKALDKTCAAMAQGPYRLQRGLAYSQYDRAYLMPSPEHQTVLVPACAHDVTCVFPARAARAALFGLAQP